MTNYNFLENLTIIERNILLVHGITKSMVKTEIINKDHLKPVNDTLVYRVRDCKKITIRYTITDIENNNYRIVIQGVNIE